MSLLRLRGVVWTCQRYLNTTGSAYTTTETDAYTTTGSDAYTTTGSDAYTTTGYTSNNTLTRRSDRETVWIPEAKISGIVGRGGRIIKTLQQITGTVISIQDRSVMKDGEVALIISGQSCAEAKETIEQLIVTDTETCVWVPEASVDVIFDRGMHKTLQRETGAFIYLDMAPIQGGLAPISITGQFKQCVNAKERIEQLTGQYWKTITGDWDTMTISVPRVKLHTIFGDGPKRDSNIRDLQEETGTKIRAQWRDAEDGQIPVRISGPHDKVREVKEKLEKRLPGELTTETIWVPRDKLGKIIGRGGSMIRSLKEKSGTEVHIEDNAVQGGMVPVDVSGSYEKCSETIKAIEQLIQEPKHWR